MPVASSAPGTANLRLVLRVGGTAALAGAVAGAFDDAEMRSETVAWTGAAVSAGSGIAALVSAQIRPSRTLLFVLALLSTAAIAQSQVNIVGPSSSGYALFYVLVAAGAGMVLGAGAVGIVLATIVLAAAPALVLGRVPPVEWVLDVGCPAFVGVLVFRQRALVLAAMRQVRELADSDPLTGVANRRAFVARLAAEGGRARRRGEGFAVLYLDLDSFKTVNDTLGHAGGDEALGGAARAVAGELRPMDLLARLGGDEFGILVPGADAAAAATVADRVGAAVAGVEVRGVRLGASAGAATYPEDGLSPDELLDAADARLMAVKRRHLLPAARAASPST